jgi:hypothetical protein
MSLDATRWAWKQRDITPSQKLILLSMADRAGEQHTCYPSIPRLVEDTGLNRKTVMKNIKIMAEMNLLVIEQGVRRSNIYTLTGVAGRESGPTLGTSPKIGTSPNTGPPVVPKQGPQVVPKQGPESTIESTSEPFLNVDAPPAAATCPYQKIVESYHKNFPAGPKVKEITPKRQKSLKARWVNGSSDLDFWDNFFSHAAKSQFLTGNNNRNWIADFDFFIRPDTATFMQEGKYHR